MTAVDVDALDKLREAATPGPWHAWRRQVIRGDGRLLAQDITDADAALIVAAVNALPELLDEVRRGRALREAVEKLIAFYDRHEYSSLNVDDLRAALAATDLS